MTHIKVYREMPNEEYVGDIIDGEPTTDELAMMLDALEIHPADEQAVFDELSGPTVIALKAADDAGD